jgi:hypothetical protein
MPNDYVSQELDAISEPRIRLYLTAEDSSEAVIVLSARERSDRPSAQNLSVTPCGYTTWGSLTIVYFWLNTLKVWTVLSTSSWDRLADEKQVALDVLVACAFGFGVLLRERDLRGLVPLGTEWLRVQPVARIQLPVRQHADRQQLVLLGANVSGISYRGYFYE